MTGFETVAYKLMISDIAVAKRTDEVETFQVTMSSSDLLKNEEANNSRHKAISLMVKLVWIQGSVTEITIEAGDKVLGMSDGNGNAWVLGYDSVPGGDHPDIRKGTYIGILGQIVSTSPIKIKAVKVMSLKNKTLLESIWEEEVKDLKAFLLGLTNPEKL